MFEAEGARGRIGIYVEITNKGVLPILREQKMHITSSASVRVEMVWICKINTLGPGGQDSIPEYCILGYEKNYTTGSMGRKSKAVLKLREMVRDGVL